MRVHKNRLLNIVISIIMVVAMVATLCTTFEAESETVSAATAFEKSISKFPDSYKPYLRALHSKYPKWKFVPYNTGIYFDTAVSEEYKDNKSLIENAYSKFLKSNASGDYNASTGKYIPKDGGNWVSASKNAIAYFMDPRNFLDAEHIYMFEQLSYDSATQTQAGVEAILDGSFMYKTNIGYITTAGKYKASNTLFSSKILEAAKKADVSAYYIASRILQEVGTKKNAKYAGMGASGSVSGQYSKTYTGIYNFYNIGAYSSANPIANGLAWASNRKDKTYNRPWTKPGKSIIGGASYIGEKYINCGQNTTYYQRFNVNKGSKYALYTHQYMTNVYGAASEAAYTSEAYDDLGIAPLAKTFVIPYFKNMPGENSTVRLGAPSKSGETIASVNLRKKPGTNSAKVITLSKGDKVSVSGGCMTKVSYGTAWLSNPYWYKVSLVKNGKSYSGYLAATYVSLSDEYSVAVGSKYKLPVSVSKGETIYYMSDNPAIATVNNSGNVTGVKAGSVTIRAFLGSGSMSAVSVKVGGTTTVAKPKRPVAKAASANYNSVKLSWQREEGVAGYIVYRRNSKGQYTLKKIIESPVSSYTDSGLTTGTEYSYKVKAYRLAVNGTKVKSAVSEAVNAIPIPSRVSITSIKSVGSSVKLTWKRIDGAGGYKIYRSNKKTGEYVQVGKVYGNKRFTYTNKKVKGGKTYYYKVAAYKKASGQVIYGNKSKVKSIKK